MRSGWTTSRKADKDVMPIHLGMAAELKAAATELKTAGPAMKAIVGGVVLAIVIAAALAVWFTT